MTRVISRLVITLVLVPICFVSAIVCGFVTTELFNWDEDRAVPAVAFGAVVVYISAFVLTWNGAIKWTARRRNRVLAACGVALLACALATWILSLWHRYRYDGPPFLVASYVLIGGGLICALARLMQESAKERMERLMRPSRGERLCPVCKYDLSGLSNLKCPECGQEYTLGVLLDEHARKGVPPGLE